jgi:hypothetical protein
VGSVGSSEERLMILGVYWSRCKAKTQISGESLLNVAFGNAKRKALAVYRS